MKDRHDIKWNLHGNSYLTFWNTDFEESRMFLTPFTIYNIFILDFLILERI